MPTYTIKIDEAFAIERFARYRAQRFRIGRISMQIVCSIGLVALGALGLALDVFPITAFALTMIVLLFSGHHIDNFVLKRALRKSPFYMATMRLVLSDDGVHVTSPISSTHLGWRVFTKVLRQSDGYLLYSGPEIYWWPDSALVEGSIEEVAQLLRDVGPQVGTATS